MLSYEWDLSMICDHLKLYSQNVCKNSLIINIILEIQFSFDIIFIQEPPWLVIQSISSSTSCEGKELVGVTHHSNWLTFIRVPSNLSNYPKVIAYINICFLPLYFYLWNDILNYRDILCILFFNQGSILFLINIYSNSF